MDEWRLTLIRIRHQEENLENWKRFAADPTHVHHDVAERMVARVEAGIEQLKGRLKELDEREPDL